MPSAKKKPSKKSRKPSADRKPDAAYRLKVLLASLFLLGFLLLSLIALSLVRHRMHPEPSPPPTQVTTPAVPAPVAPVSDIEDVRVEVESLLLRSGISLPQVKTEKADNSLRYEVVGAFPAEDLLAGLSSRLSRLSADIRLEPLPTEGALRIYRGGELTCLVLFRPSSSLPQATPAKVRARASIIMDDLGRDLATARALLAIDLPVTFAILPGEPHAAEVASLAHRGGREVMIHIPMEPQSYPATNPGSDALLIGQSPEEIRKRFESFVERVPFAVGGNNHMGSRFTEYREGMEVVLSAMKERGLFFVDSRTTGHSIAFEEARRVGVAAAARDVFLDNEQDVEEISRQIRSLAVMAGKRGQAVGICHPYPQTLEALRREIPYLRQQGIEIVPASHLLIR